MSNREDQQTEELSLFISALKLARARGGESRRNATLISGDARSSDRPDIIVQVNDKRRLVGIEHFRVDQFIAHGKKVESKAARFSADAERTRRNHEDEAHANNLGREAYAELGNLISRQLKEQSNSCVDDISISLEAGLFGDSGRGHVSKIPTYREQTAQLDASVSTQIGFLIEFHTDLRQWFLNRGVLESGIHPGEFPISCEAYELLRRASKYVDWLVLAFCPAIGEELYDAAVVKCTNGMFELSCKRQGILPTRYIGLGKSSPFGKQTRQGEVQVDFREERVSYVIENTSEQMNELELFHTATSGAAEAINLARKRKPFAATTSVQLVYDLTKNCLTHKRTQITTCDVLGAIRQMKQSELELRIKRWQTRWNSEGAQYCPETQ